MEDMTYTDLILQKRMQLMFFDSTYELFVRKAIEESVHYEYTDEEIETANEAALELERLASEQEVTVDYYIEEFLTS